MSLTFGTRQKNAGDTQAQDTPNFQNIHWAKTPRSANQDKHIKLLK